MCVFYLPSGPLSCMPITQLQTTCWRALAVQCYTLQVTHALLCFVQLLSQVSGSSRCRCCVIACTGSPPAMSSSCTACSRDTCSQRAPC